MNETLAIVDLETTGTSPVYGRIIEIGILRVERGALVRTFESLVNPGCFIHPTIEHLTGITNDDVVTAPPFDEISAEVTAMLEGAIFVAHNARFDYGFLKNEFRRLGIAWNAKCLCTMKLSRKLFPEQPRHDLGSIIQRMGISCDHRHRAMGDARAVYDFLLALASGDRRESLTEAMNVILKNNRLPTGLDKSVVDSLPETPGVYLFFGKDGELLYVGKSKNIRGRVLGHFAGDHRSAKEMEMCHQVHAVEARSTAGNLGASLLESRLIKELRPIYNKVARERRNLFVARRHVNRDGYIRIALEEIERIETKTHATVMGIFKSMKQAKEFLTEKAKSHRLCYRLLGLEHGKSYCFGYHVKQCTGACMGDEPPVSYNSRVEEAFRERSIRAWPFEGTIVIEEKGTEQGEVFFVDQWCLVGSYSYAEDGSARHQNGDHRFDYDSYKILLRYITDRANRRSIRRIPREEFEKFVNEGD